MRAIIAILLTACLAGCGGTTFYNSNHPRLDPPDQAALRACDLPTNLPKGEMTQAQIEKYWGLDRKHQIECAKRHGILSDYIIERDSALSGKS